MLFSICSKATPVICYRQCNVTIEYKRLMLSTQKNSKPIQTQSVILLDLFTFYPSKRRVSIMHYPFSASWNIIRSQWLWGLHSNQRIYLSHHGNHISSQDTFAFGIVVLKKLVVWLNYVSVKSSRSMKIQFWAVTVCSTQFKHILRVQTLQHFG